MSSDSASITIYSDYVCPFCYLGRVSFDKFNESSDADLAIDWHPFDLRRQKRGPDGTIDHSVDDGKDEAYFEQARQNVARLRAEYDAEDMRNLDDIPDDVDSYNAQLVSFYVKTEHPEEWPAFDDAILDALWVDGQNIGNIDVLTDLAANAGVDSDDIRSVVDDPELRNHLEEKFSDAYEHGISGVPTYVYDDYVARGAVPPEQLARLIDGS